MTAERRRLGAEALNRSGVPFVSKNFGAHLIVNGRYDFWPGTGYWKERGDGKRKGQGVATLLNELQNDAMRRWKVSSEPTEESRKEPGPMPATELPLGTCSRCKVLTDFNDANRLRAHARLCLDCFLELLGDLREPEHLPDLRDPQSEPPW